MKFEESLLSSCPPPPPVPFSPYDTMRVLSSLVLVFSAINTLLVAASPVLESRQSGIDQTTYNDLERYTKYSSAVYQWICPKPLGNTLVKQVRCSRVFNSSVTNLYLLSV